MTERHFATDVVLALQSAGHRALWAGGCVRDKLLGLAPADYDVATSATPQQVRRLFPRTIAIGASFGVIEVIGPRSDDGEWSKVQVATFRSDGAYTDGRRPDAVTFSSPEDDAQRRDFTINGLFFDPVTKQLIDYVGGKADLDAKILRAIGDPTARFIEDKLRVLRAVRMATRFDLLIEPQTLAAGRLLAPEIRVVSAERIADELRKLLSHPQRARGVHLLREFDLVRPILPELERTLEEGCAVVAALPAAAGFSLAFASLLISLTRKIANTICKRLKLSNEERLHIEWLVENRSAFVDAATLPPSRRNPLLIHPGIADLLALHRADAFAAERSAAPIDFCERLLNTTPRDALDPPPLLTGDDLTARGLLPGPAFKRILDAVRAKQLDGELTTLEAAIHFANQSQ